MDAAFTVVSAAGDESEGTGQQETEGQSHGATFLSDPA
jgi:hypothetical protein